MRRALALLVVLAACADDLVPGPSIVLETSPLCPDPTMGCINAGAETFAVDDVRVIYKRTPGQPLASLRVLVDHGERTGRQIWDERMALSMLETEGPADSTDGHWREHFSELGADLRAYDGADYATIAVEGPAPRFGQLWKLLRQGLDKPSRRSALLDFVRRRAQHGFDAAGDAPGPAANARAWALASRGTGMNRAQEQLVELGRVDTDSAASALTGMLSKARLTVVFAGDVERAELSAQVHESFGARLPVSVHAYPPDNVPASADVRPVSELLAYPGSPTWCVSSYMVGPRSTAADYPALRVALAELDRRLFEQVRDEAGLAYTVGASSYFYRTIIVGLWVTTNQPLAALTRAREVIAEMTLTPLTDAQLAAARQNVRTQLLLSSDTPSGLAATLGDWQLTYGDRMGVDVLLAQLELVTAEQVRSAIATYLRRAVTVAAGNGEGMTRELLDGLYPQ